MLEPLKERTHLFCVGDDAASLFMVFVVQTLKIFTTLKNVPDAQIFKLEKNYRSTQQILDLSNWLLEQSPIQYDKHLDAYTVVTASSLKKCMCFPMNLMKPSGLRLDIKERHYLEGASGIEHMVLVRSSFATRHIEACLCIAANIPYRFIGGMKLLETAHVKDLLSLLRVVANPLLMILLGCVF